MCFILFNFTSLQRPVIQYLGGRGGGFFGGDLVADLGEGPLWPRPPLFWVKNEEMTEGRKASRASKSKSPPPPLPPLAQGLDPALGSLDQRAQKGASLKVTCPCKLGGRLSGTLAKTQLCSSRFPRTWDGQLLVCQLTSITGCLVERRNSTPCKNDCSHGH